ncbi:hypothetical protein QQ008_24515 [Fulvivirgaceae bacterium BMA10]|uniref:VWFA domain-containing protein n=1 Tax=Splendidivirga corallicola TaxID=3051826 RepID=A0ABT8KUY8_9BACT|nr:hypothetical protein [Fulvivirgaceae bacterium BMA10]
MRLLNLFFRVALVGMLAGCNALTECENIKPREAILLIDVTDKQLFEDIEADLKANLPTFMAKTGLGNIAPCESFTLTLVPISAKEGLQATSETIAINRKGQSYQAEKQQASPAPLVNLLKGQLTEFKALTENDDLTSGSSIANVMIKALTHANLEAETTLIIFSDMIENNQYLNMYRHIPATEELSEVVPQLIDPLVLEEFQARQREGLDANIIIVCKDSPNKKVNARQRDVKSFWAGLLGEMKLHNIQFMDNLTNIN